MPNEQDQKEPSYENGVTDLGLKTSDVESPGDVQPGASPLDVAAVLEGSRLFVLGGTGFLGKVFWVMLLDRYPDIGKIFLLVRSSKDMTSEERFWAKVATSDALAPLRERHGSRFEPFLREKIVPVDGDVGRALCGVDGSLVRELRGTIDAVVNVAGVVDFNPPLDEALDANAFGAQNLVALARALGDAPLFHTSTCYVAGRRRGLIKEVDPRTYPFPRATELGAELWDPDREIEECLELIAQAKHRCEDAFRQSEFAEQARKNLQKRGEPSEGPAFADELSRVKRKFISDLLVEAGNDRASHWGWPNIYTYTKSIGEQVIARSGLPFTIGRPACCETTVKFPFPGWNEGISTSVPIIYMSIQGQIMTPARDIPLDFIPTDMVTSGMILSLAELLEGKQAPVYQYAASDRNPCSASRFGELVGLYKRKYYQRRGKGNPFLNFLQSHLELTPVSVKEFETLSSPFIAQAAGSLSRALSQVPALKPAAATLDAVKKREERIAEVMRLYSPFTTERNGPFDCTNTRAAYARLTDADREKLLWEPESLDWADFMMKVHMPGLEKWIFPEMEKKLKRPVKALRAHETLVSLLDQMAKRHDRSPALQRFEEDGFSRITYLDLRKRARALGLRLVEAGVKKGDAVLLTAKNDPAWAFAYFGILCAGAIAVPVDAGLEVPMVANLVTESGARFALSDRPLDIAGLDVWDLHTAFSSAGADDAPILEPEAGLEITPEDVASLIYTSGTTGSPKGVMLTHANFTSLIAALAPIFPLKAGDRLLSVLPLHHTFEFTCGLLLPLSRGAKIAYLDELNADRLSAGLKAGRVTAMVGVPALWQMLERRILSQVRERGALAETAFEWATELNRLLGKTLGVDAGRVLFGPVHQALGGNIKWLISGGAALPKETHDLFSGLGLRLTEGYGLTEAAPVLTVAKSSPNSPSGQVGKAIPGVEIKIDNPDDHGVGEVIARGPNVMAGYTDPEATSRVIDPQGWLHTGDLGKLDKQGRLEIVGRLKDVIVTATGENVYPEDVERRLGPVAHMTELCIVGVESKGSERVACLAVPAPDDDAPRSVRLDRATRSLRAAIAALPYGQQPSIVHLYDAPLPRTSTRKIKRGEVAAILRRMMAATAPADEATASAGYVRKAIVAVSGRSLEEAQPQATLQGDLGFDSLMLTELLEALESKGSTIDPVALQACRTVADIEKLAGESAHAPPARHFKKIETTERKPIVLPPAVQDSAKAFIGKLQDAFYGQVMQPRVTGRAFIPHNRNTIVVANHASHLDMGFVRHALGKYGEDVVSLAAQDYFFEGGGLRRAFFENFTNLQAFDRKNGLRQSLRQAADVIERGRTVLVFPEGTRSTTGEVGEFKPLVGYLALTHGVDLLPVYLGGTFESMRKGAVLPTRRNIVARIGPPLTVADMRRLTAGMNAQDAAREVARYARQAVLALSDGKVLDLARSSAEDLKKEREHPLVGVFSELEERFVPGQVDKSVSFYFTLGGDAFAKWTVLIDGASCQIKLGKPESGTADCVLKTSPEIFTKIVRESYLPGPAEFLSGAVKSNDVSLLFTFQKAFQLS
ncbi:AMP-binding protein [Pendulispora albinea]|uniref:AMP-binding protein n=1 Tax=Pendulispora albinea TaxID=2741071 RepID=A0ABZ2LUZ6_9BACT